MLSIQERSEEVPHLGIPQSATLYRRQAMLQDGLQVPRWTFYCEISLSA
jgi:hypothetical protein